ncbi:4-hydroxythreonine-4-phosphate dehydrogenase [Aerococcus sp. HMSC23C02]|nr:4-hydroxythreonine-4-phosphate dehydrogenase [Aerococcus sp. HMSC23C02]
MIMTKEYVVLTMGDPAGIGPEIVCKSFAKEEVFAEANVAVVGDADILKLADEICQTGLTIHPITSFEEGKYEPGTLDVFDLDNVNMDTFEWGKVSAECGQASYDYIKKAYELAKDGQAAAMVTTTINKESLSEAGIKQLGHTDILQDLTGVEEPLTMFEVKGLRVTFYSKHVSLKEACDLISKEGIKHYTKRTMDALKTLGVEDPSVAIAGLNPHCGDGGLFGSEEIESIIPAVEEMQAEGIKVYGPIGADSVFHQALMGKYDGVLSLYHDQGHIATKMVDFDRTISITHGLPFLRTSVDHGTAFDIAGTGVADEISLDEAIRLACHYSGRFKAAHEGA